jgi:phosphoribosylformimino-5-aminoimidazole carboxamide ribotide isomerase
MDTLGGEVVWGIAGERQSYRPLASPLVRGSRPLDVARALQGVVGHDWLYLADLEGIVHDALDWSMLDQLAGAGCRLIVDAGLRDADRAHWLIDTGAAAVVAALETLPDPQALGQIVEEVGGDVTIFSLDLRGGKVAGNLAAWGGPDPLSVAHRAIAEGIGGMIVLDVAGVGMQQGVPTTELCQQVRTEAPQLPLITGGGVRNAEDVRQLLAGGVDSVLIASALHRGHLGPAEVAALARPQYPTS